MRIKTSNMILIIAAALPILFAIILLVALKIAHINRTLGSSAGTSGMFIAGTWPLGTSSNISINGGIG
jgi:hypothetical protein